jgi:hypothetical protein
MMRPEVKVEKVYLYPKPVDFRNPSMASPLWPSFSVLRRSPAA